MGSKDWVSDTEPFPAVEFSSSDARVNAGSASGLDNLWDGGGTMIVRGQFDASQTDSFPRIVAKSDSSGQGGEEWSLVLNSNQNGKLDFEIHWDPNRGQYIANDKKVPRGRYLTIGISYNADSASNAPTIYFDGTQQTIRKKATPSGTRPDDSGKDLLFGNVDALTHPLDGRLSGVIAVNRELSFRGHGAFHNQARRGFPDLVRTRSDVGLLGGGTAVTVSEAAALAAQANLQATDTALSSESAALSATGAPTATDSASATEQAFIGSTATPSATETATITEAITLAATATWSITETVGSAVTEAATLAVTASLSATDTATAAEFAQVSSQVTLAAQEAATASEALRLETEARLGAKESVTVTEAAQIQVNAALDLIEQASVVETVKIGAVATWSVTETVGTLITGRISEVGRNTVKRIFR